MEKTETARITKDELDLLIAAAEIEEIEVEELKHDEKRYSRTGGVDKSAVEDYSHNIAGMPPIIINQNNLIVNGVHRYKALQKRDQKMARVKRIKLDEENIELANLLADLDSKVRHTRKDFERMVQRKYKPDDPEFNKWLMEELKVPQQTFSDWTKDIRQAHLKEINKSVIDDLLKPELTTREIAERYGYKSHEKIIKTQKDFWSILPTLGKSNQKTKKEIQTELDENNFDFLMKYHDFINNDILIYNIWNLKSGDNNSHFGHFPLVFMKNLLYYHTEPFDLVFDPFGGSGTTIDACKQMYRKYFVTDLNPDKSVDEIRQFDINNIDKEWPTFQKPKKDADGNELTDENGDPVMMTKNMPIPDFVFLDPPYWLQAKNKYSESENDFANMTLEEFYNRMENVLNTFKQKEVKKIAIVISPTQYPNEDHEFEDHIFKFHEMLSDKYKIKMRYQLPYSTQQYNGNQVKIMKEERKCISTVRDLVVWECE